MGQPSMQNNVLGIFLVLSVVANAGYFFWQTSHGSTLPMESSPATTATAPMQATHLVRDLDSDHDGVLDHHDSCPFSSQCKGDMCPPIGWVSGRATDFDGDGCADGSEDKDKDNDGILDVHDSCPFTPQEHAFVSNFGSDFDGDGCVDGVEDFDDDNDLVPNFVDVCPLTASGAVSDGQGCSEGQRKLRENAAVPSLPTISSNPQEEALPGDDIQTKISLHLRTLLGEDLYTYLESWVDAIKGSGIEVVVGAILSAVLGQMYVAYMSVKSKLPEKPLQSLHAVSAIVPDSHRQPTELSQYQLPHAGGVRASTAIAYHNDPWSAALNPVCAVARLRAQQ